MRKQRLTVTDRVVGAIGIISSGYLASQAKDDELLSPVDNTLLLVLMIGLGGYILWRAISEVAKTKNRTTQQHFFIMLRNVVIAIAVLAILSIILVLSTQHLRQ